jgi:hypothetical protein
MTELKVGLCGRIKKAFLYENGKTASHLKDKTQKGKCMIKAKFKIKIQT